MDRLIAFLDINEIDRRDGLLSIAEKLVSDPSIQLYNYSRRGRIILYFKQLLNSQISLEEFMGLGDTSELDLYEDRDYLSSVFDLVEDKPGPGIVIIDSESVDFFEMQISNKLEIGGGATLCIV